MTGSQKSIVINWTAIIGVIIAGVAMIGIQDVRESAISGGIQGRFVQLHSEQLLRQANDLRSVERRVSTHDGRISRMEAYIEDVQRRLENIQQAVTGIDDYLRNGSNKKSQ